jgi:small nuclear ribonucleoprotein (snRNP)-like protein
MANLGLSIRIPK